MGEDSQDLKDKVISQGGEFQENGNDIKATYTEGNANATAGEGYTIAEAEDGGRAVAVSGDRDKINAEMAGGKHKIKSSSDDKGEPDQQDD